MKSVIMGEKKKKSYCLGYEFWLNDPSRRYGICFSDGSTPSPQKLEINDTRSSDSGEIKSYEAFDEYIKVKIVTEFNRELKVGENIRVDNKEYPIQKVTHGDDGMIYYYVNNYITVEDKNSYEQASKDLGLRKAFLEGRMTELKKIELDKQNNEDMTNAYSMKVHTVNELVKTKKKWYQFWK